MMVRRPKISGETQGRAPDPRRWVSRIARTARSVILLCAVVGVALLVRWYDFERLRPEAERFVSGLIRPGAFVVYTPVDEDLPIDRGSIVEAWVEVDVAGERLEGMVLGRVAAAPGDAVRFVPAGPRNEVAVEGERLGVFATDRERARIQSELEGDASKAGRVPAQRYLLLRPSEGGEGQDSRRFGLVARSALRRKLITYF